MKFKLRANRNEVLLFLRKLEGDLERNEICADKSYKIMLSLEELVTNSMKYAPSCFVTVSVKFDVAENRANLEYIEFGDPYNIMQNHDLDKCAIQNKVDSFSEGGLGVFIFASLATDIIYKYSDELGANILTFNLS